GSSSGILCHSYFGSTERFFLRDRSHCLIARGRLCCAELFRSRLSSVSLRLESAHPRAPGFESTRKALALCKSSYRIFECQRDRHGLADGAVERTESSVELVDCNRSSYDRCSDLCDSPCDRAVGDLQQDDQDVVDRLEEHLQHRQQRALRELCELTEELG